jgi:hypothetical protein
MRRLACALVASVLSGAMLPAVPAAADEAAQPAPAGAPASRWALPDPGSCSPKGGRLSPGMPEDATATPFQTGDVFEVDRLAVLQNYLPGFMWQERERFFYEGMRLEIGPCFADYAPPSFFQEATQRNAGKAKLDEDGGLEGYVAGLPFAPQTIAVDDPQAGLQWFWNVQQRYQGAGFRGRFRLTDLVGRIGRAEPFIGRMFKVILTHRADLPAPEHTSKSARGNVWVAGGLFEQPFDAREYAWLQYRNTENLVSARRSDDLHAYLPQWRRVRRMNANQVEGLYMPSFSVGVVPNQTLPIGGGAGQAGGVAAGAAVGGDGGTIQTKRSGYEGLEFRPNLYSAKIVGLHDVLAPINIAQPVWPANEDRDFGPWGLSFASDRWDFRRALVIEATQREATGASETARQILYVDLQTLQPLFTATFDTKNEMTNVGIFAGRWSETREDYPRWPDDTAREVRTIDSVGAAFANLAESGSWRRESWDNVSTPPPDDEVKRMISTGELTKRH